VEFQNSLYYLVNGVMKEQLCSQDELKNNL